MKKLGAICTYLLLLHFDAFCQSTLQFGLMPSLNLNKKLPKDWSVNFKSEFRQSLYRENLQYVYDRTDLSLLIAKKIGIQTKIAGGYHIIFEPGGPRNRYIQQVNVITNTPLGKLGHRFSSDQTFGQAVENVYRIRYRISSEIPLTGDQLDRKEYYIKLNNEYLGIFEVESRNDFEIRILGFFGYKISEKSKLESGIDYRIDDFILGNTRNRMWFSVQYYRSF